MPKRGAVNVPNESLINMICDNLKKRMTEDPLEIERILQGEFDAQVVEIGENITEVITQDPEILTLAV